MSKLFSFSLFFVSFAPLWLSVLIVDCKSVFENQTNLWTEKISIACIVTIMLVSLYILRKELHEIREACVAKNIVFNVKNMKIILSKFLISLITRVNNIEESLIAKGYSNE